MKLESIKYVLTNEQSLISSPLLLDGTSESYFLVFFYDGASP